MRRRFTVNNSCRRRTCLKTKSRHQTIPAKYLSQTTIIKSLSSVPYYMVGGTGFSAKGGCAVALQLIIPAGAEPVLKQKRHQRMPLICI